MLNHAVDLTTDIIYSLTGELTHGERASDQSREPWRGKKNEEQLQFHSSVWIRLGQNSDETVQESPSRSIRGKRKKKLYTNTLVENERVGRTASKLTTECKTHQHQLVNNIAAVTETFVRENTIQSHKHTLLRNIPYDELRVEAVTLEEHHTAKRISA